MAGQKVAETTSVEETRRRAEEAFRELFPEVQVAPAGESLSEGENDAILLEALDLISESMETRADRWNQLLDNVEDSLVEMEAQRHLVAPDTA